MSIPQISLLGRGSFLKVWSEGKDGAMGDSIGREAYRGIETAKGRQGGWVEVTEARYRLQIAGDERKRRTPRVRKPQ